LAAPRITHIKSPRTSALTVNSLIFVSAGTYDLDVGWLDSPVPDFGRVLFVMVANLSMAGEARKPNLMQ
jgi:hypothetical protein